MGSPVGQAAFDLGDPLTVGAQHALSAQVSCATAQRLQLPPGVMEHRGERRRLPGAPEWAEQRLGLDAAVAQALTPHSLRRTFASILYALGEDPGVVMDEMGHTDPALSLRVYRQSMRRGEDEKQALRALVEMTDNRE
jgi:integrase